MNIVKDEVKIYFCFTCFYVQGAIDLLMTVYKENFKSIGGYLVDMQRVITPDYFIFTGFILYKPFNCYKFPNRSRT